MGGRERRTLGTDTAPSGSPSDSARPSFPWSLVWCLCFTLIYPSYSVLTVPAVNSSPSSNQHFTGETLYDQIVEPELPKYQHEDV